MKYEIECNHLLDDSFLAPDRLYDGCYQKFLFESDNIFKYFDIGYYGEIIDKYYVVCPNCGHIIWLDFNIINDDIKNNAKGSEESYHQLYKKNLLISEFFYMNYEAGLSRTDKYIKIKKRY